jgi:hypothetical protein
MEAAALLQILLARANNERQVGATEATERATERAKEGAP